jgi:hypothetical protein
MVDLLLKMVTVKLVNIYMMDLILPSINQKSDMSEAYRSFIKKHNGIAVEKATIPGFLQLFAARPAPT